MTGALSLPAQIRVQGTVVDIDTKEPLTGATVRGLGSGEGTYTDGYGKFNLRTFAEEIRISFIGYKQVTIRDFEDGANLYIEMSPLETTLQTAVVTARPSPVEMRTPAPLLKITPRDLQRDDRVSIRPALNRVTGVFMQSGALNTNRITIRGIGNRSPFATAKIRAYLDDIPLTSGVGETTIEDIDLSIIDQVRVWKGPTASTYGAGLGGMIHLQTKKDLEGEQSSFSLSGVGGSFGLFRGVADLHYINPNKMANLYLNYNRTHSDGYRENNEYDREALTAYGSVATGMRDETSFIASHTDLKAFIPSSLNRDDFENNPQIAAPNWAAIEGFEDSEKVLVGLTHRHDFIREPHGKTLSNRTTLFTSFRNNFEPRPFNFLRESSQIMGFRSAMEYRNTFKRERPNLTVGGEYFRENYQWQTNEITESAQFDTLLSDNREIRQYYNLFAEANYEITKSLFFTAGLNFNSTRYTLTDRYPVDGVDLSGKQDFDGVVSPRLGFGFHPFFYRILFFGTVSHGFSPPTLEETLNPNGTLNRNIQPEKGWNYELGLRTNDLLGRITFELTWYTMKIRDLLVARRTAEDQYVGINAGKTDHTGLEMLLRYRLTDALSLWGNWSRANYTFKEFVDQEKDFSGNALTGQPPHQVNAGIDLNTDFGLYGYLTYEFVDAYPLNDANSEFTDSYQLMNLKLGYRRELGRRLALDLYAGINNLWDEKYASMVQINAAGFGGAPPRYFYPGLPRNYYGGVKVQYLLGSTSPASN
jgi:iron complex outermembrane receptor protein